MFIRRSHSSISLIVHTLIRLADRACVCSRCPQSAAVQVRLVKLANSFQTMQTLIKLFHTDSMHASAIRPHLGKQMLIWTGGQTAFWRASALHYFPYAEPSKCKSTGFMFSTQLAPVNKRMEQSWQPCVYISHSTPSATLQSNLRNLLCSLLCFMEYSSLLVGYRWLFRDFKKNLSV